jgi:protein-tyrosine phosphatase
MTNCFKCGLDDPGIALGPVIADAGEQTDPIAVALQAQPNLCSRVGMQKSNALPRAIHGELRIGSLKPSRLSQMGLLRSEVHGPATMNSKQILFLCTGNYYRSRYAEELFNFRARSKPLAWRAFSRGLAEKGSTNNIGPMSRFALEALQAKAIVPEGAGRNPLPCSLADFDRAHLVVALKEAEHRPILAKRFPGWENRATYWHVDDIDAAKPVEAIAMMDQLVRDLIRNIDARS